MHKAVAEKKDEGYEGPAAMMDQTLNLMEKIDYPIPPVFLIIQRQVEESLGLLEDGDLETFEEEMEEIVKLREALCITPDKSWRQVIFFDFPQLFNSTKKTPDQFY